MNAAGLVAPDVNMDSLFMPSEQRFGFASLVRCSVVIRRKKKDSEFECIGTDGNVIEQTVAAEPGFLTSCIERHLKNGLPESVKLVALLGSAKPNVSKIMQALDGVPCDPNAEVAYAYRALGRMVVHLPHPAGGNRDSINAFCSGTSDRPQDAGTLDCRRQVLLAVAATALT